MFDEQLGWLELPWEKKKEIVLTKTGWTKIGAKKENEETDGTKRTE